ncbi:disease resistance protein RML1A-like [Sesbania bispinosa]|nr:disease resistance protein RML1A-like [Sesbania bispinosa]
MPKTGDSFVPQMDAKAMRAFSRAGKRKQNLATVGAATRELVEKNKLLKGQAEEIAKARLATTELESLRKKLKDVTLEKDKLQGDFNNCKKEKESCEVLLEQKTASLKDTSEKLKSVEEKLATEQIGRKTDTNNLKAEIAFQYEVGFEKAVGQVKFLHPDLNVDEVGPFKEIKDGKLVEIPDDEE